MHNSYRQLKALMSDIDGIYRTKGVQEMHAKSDILRILQRFWCNLGAT
jgi:hypothetical protein